MELSEEANQNFKLDITEPSCFFGRGSLVEEIVNLPIDVWVILGGRRIGKTSLLNIIEWNFVKLDSSVDNIIKPFPIVLNLNASQPKDLDNFRYILIKESRESLQRWLSVPAQPVLRFYKSYLEQIVSGEITVGFLDQIKVKLNVSNPDYEKRLNEEGFHNALDATIEEIKEKTSFNCVCFLLDGAEFIARQEWATDAWNYLRSIKDAKSIFKHSVGMLLSGYRELKDYQQKVGSPLLNISTIRPLSPLTEPESVELIKKRIQIVNATVREDGRRLSISDENVHELNELTGGHPCLLQAAMDEVSKGFSSQKILSRNELTSELIHQHKDLFAAWWNQSGDTGRLGDHEKQMYRVLLQQRVATINELSNITGFGRITTRDALEILSATGIIRQVARKQYAIGAKLFEEWLTGINE